MDTPKPTLTRRAALAAGAAAPFALAACASSTLRPEVPRPLGSFDPVDALIDEGIAKGWFPGAAFTASVDGRIVHERFAGTCITPDRAGEPMDASRIVMCYSFSKLVSATAVMAVVEDGALDLDAPLAEALPDFAGGGRDAITLRHLLTHAAGIPDEAGPADPDGRRIDRADWSRYFAHLRTLEPEWVPGERAHYHAVSGLFLAALAATRASGAEDFASLLRERVLDPIGADELAFAPPAEASRVVLTPPPGEPLDLEHPLFRNWRWHPGGGLFGTTRDMVKVLELHLRDGEWNGRRILAPATIREMRRPQFAEQIAEGRPGFDYWALGMLTRGTTTTGWFGFGSKLSPAAFGHAGINTVVGNADPERGVAYAFAASGAGTAEETTAYRNALADRIAEAVPPKGA